MNKISIEQNTGKLYQSCFEIFDDEQWLHQGELLAEQLGLNRQQVADKVCFDGGCGHGALVYQLAQLGAQQVVGLDLEPTIKAEKFNNLNVEFIKGSLLEIPFPDDHFDLVVSSGVVHHTVDPEKAFSELVRILKPGGKIVLGVYGKHGLFPWILWCARLVTVKVPLIRQPLMDRLISIFGFDPIIRYQILDYLYVPLLKRYSPRQLLKEYFHKNGLRDAHRIANITPEKGRKFTSQRTSYSYDYRTFKSRLLFGHGFIVIEATK